MEDEDEIGTEKVMQAVYEMVKIEIVQRVSSGQLSPEAMFDNSLKSGMAIGIMIGIQKLVEMLPPDDVMRIKDHIRKSFGV